MRTKSRSIPAFSIDVFLPGSLRPAFMVHFFDGDADLCGWLGIYSRLWVARNAEALGCIRSDLDLMTLASPAGTRAKREDFDFVSQYRLGLSCGIGVQLEIGRSVAPRLHAEAIADLVRSLAHTLEEGVLVLREQLGPTLSLASFPEPSLLSKSRPRARSRKTSGLGESPSARVQQARSHLSLIPGDGETSAPRAVLRLVAG